MLSYTTLLGLNVIATAAKQDTSNTSLTAILAKLTSDPATQTTLAAVLAKLPSDPASQTTLTAVLAKLSDDPATQTTLAAILAKLTNDPATQTTLTAVLAKLSSDPATQTTLAAVLAKLADPATQTTLAAILAKLSSDPATQTTLASILTKLADPATQTTLTAVLAKLTADPATQTTLAAILVKLADPATQTTLAAVLAKLSNIENITLLSNSVSASQGPWIAGTAYTLGQAVQSYGNIYTCTGAGTSGVHAPNGTTSAIIDGTVTWTYTYVLASTDTANYKSISIQLNPSVFAGGIRVLQSNDNVNWYPTPGYGSGMDLAPLDEMLAPGIMLVPVSGRYFCVVPFEYFSGTLSVSCYLRTVDAVGSGADMLARSLDQIDPMPLNVSDIRARRDILGAAIPSDAPQPITGSLNNILTYQIIDTQGYNSITITFAGGGASLGITTSVSNDQVNWSTVFGWEPNAIGGGSNRTGMNTGEITGRTSVYPCYGRFFLLQIISATGTNATPLRFTAYLRQLPFQPFTYAYVAGDRHVGDAPVSDPIVIGAVTTAGIITRVITDTTGRLITVPLTLAPAVDQAGISRASGAVVSPASNVENLPAQTVMDVTQIEGQSLGEIFLQILLELRILNQQIFELPRVLGNGIPNLDEPQAYRNDPTLFAG